MTVSDINCLRPDYKQRFEWLAAHVNAIFLDNQVFDSDYHAPPVLQESLAIMTNNAVVDNLFPARVQSVSVRTNASIGTPDFSGICIHAILSSQLIEIQKFGSQVAENGLGFSAKNDVVRSVNITDLSIIVAEKSVNDLCELHAIKQFQQ